jgi:hypothetical protein
MSKSTRNRLVCKFHYDAMFRFEKRLVRLEATNYILLGLVFALIGVVLLK